MPSSVHGDPQIGDAGAAFALGRERRDSAAHMRLTAIPRGQGSAPRKHAPPKTVEARLDAISHAHPKHSSWQLRHCLFPGPTENGSTAIPIKGEL